jgi:hypothetical protein
MINAQYCKTEPCFLFLPTAIEIRTSAFGARAGQVSHFREILTSTHFK